MLEGSGPSFAARQRPRSWCWWRHRGVRAGWLNSPGRCRRAGRTPMRACRAATNPIGVRGTRAGHGRGVRIPARHARGTHVRAAGRRRPSQVRGRWWRRRMFAALLRCPHSANRHRWAWQRHLGGHGCRWGAVERATPGTAERRCCCPGMMARLAGGAAEAMRAGCTSRSDCCTAVANHLSRSSSRRSSRPVSRVSAPVVGLGGTPDVVALGQSPLWRASCGTPSPCVDAERTARRGRLMPAPEVGVCSRRARRSG